VHEERIVEGAESVVEADPECTYESTPTETDRREPPLAELRMFVEGGQRLDPRDKAGAAMLLDVRGDPAPREAATGDGATPRKRTA